MAIAVVGLMMFSAAGCGASVGQAHGSSTTSSTSASPTTSPNDASRRGSPATGRKALLEQHLASSFVENGGDSKATAECLAKELVSREGGVAGLAKLGIDVSDSNAELSDAINQMLQQRLLTSETEPFDRFVDALFACGVAQELRSDFLAQLQEDGNSPTTSKCLADHVLGDRYLRLVLIVGTKEGATEDPRVKARFFDPIVAAVDRAAHDCGVVSWGGS